MAGRHADNIAPFCGGLVLIRSMDPLDVVRLPVPRGWLVLAHPERTMSTREAARSAGAVTLGGAAPGRAGGGIVAAASGDLALLGRRSTTGSPSRRGHRRCRVREPRPPLSGRGPGLLDLGQRPHRLCVVGSEVSGTRVAAAMESAYRALGVPCTTRVAGPEFPGGSPRAMSFTT